MTIVLMKGRYSRAVQAWVVERKGGYAPGIFAFSGAQAEWRGIGCPEGVWLGHLWSTTHRRVAVKVEVLEVRAVQRRPLAELCR